MIYYCISLHHLGTPVATREVKRLIISTYCSVLLETLHGTRDSAVIFPDVHVEVSLLSRPEAAMWTGEWLLTRVPTVVHLQFGFAVSHVIAFWVGALPSSVDP